jgi:hypothetical protein
MCSLCEARDLRDLQALLRIACPPEGARKDPAVQLRVLRTIELLVRQGAVTLPPAQRAVARVAECAANLWVGEDARALNGRLLKF